VISSPSITTLDNHTAYIESGSEIPYQTASDTTGPETEFKKAVLRLEVTPHVIDDDILKIKIFASKDEPDMTLANDAGEPAVLTRTTETTLLLKDGQTTVIAGLIETTNTDDEFGVPFLMDIPYLGYLFKKRITDKGFDDLLIFVTPHILNKKAGERDLTSIESYPQQETVESTEYQDITPTENDSTSVDQITESDPIPVEQTTESDPVSFEQTSESDPVPTD